MKKVLLLLFVFCLCGTSVLAQYPDHVLISEFVVTPTDGEFIEIFNPTTGTIDLTNYYVTDAISSNNNAYVNMVNGGFTVGGTDFMVKFPDGTSIDAGQHLTVAFSGAGFMTTFGVAADFEILANDAGVTDMTQVAVGGSAGLSNSGEMIMVFYWDGTSDLVKDVDYVVWGDKAEAVDKSGLAIDGPDADTDASTYADDTPVAAQTIVDADNDGDNDPHDFGMSAQRRLGVEDLEDWGANGNGITGHDETGEDTSWKGGIWSINEPATPGWRALGGTLSVQDGKLMPDSLTIADVQFVRADSIGSGPTGRNDDSPFTGEVITVSGIVQHDARIIDVGNRWAFFVSDVRGGPWSGFFVIQHDTTTAGADGTLITAVNTGDLVRITGTMEEFPAGANTASNSQQALLDLSVPLQLLEVGQPVPEPIVLRPEDLGFTTNPATGNRTQDPQLSERWEGTLVRFENLLVIQNDGSTGSNTMIVGDGNGNNLVLDDYFEAVDNPTTNNGGIWPGFPAGSLVNVTGFINAGTSTGNVTINPRTFADVEIAAAPPNISEVSRNPAVPTSSQAVTVSATITDQDGSVAGANVVYSVDDGADQTVAMTATSGSVWTGDIPAQADGAFVQYHIQATDDAGNSSTAPGNLSLSKFFYFVRDGGVTIKDIQFIPDAFAGGGDASSFNGLEVTLTGTVTSTQADFSGGFINNSYYIQDAEDLWSGIQVFDATNTVALGHNVTVTGTVVENFSLTRLNNVTSFTVNSAENTVAPLVRTTGELATTGANPEAFESVLVEVRNVTVSDPFPDDPRNFGEIAVTDGSGDMRVDDESMHMWSQNPDGDESRTNSVFAGGEAITFVRGIHHFHNGLYRIQPRNNADLGEFTVVSVEDRGIPLTFDLSPNYPNPFNPETTIRYQLAAQGEIRITIFNVLGQKVRTLVDQVQPAGVHRVQWNGTNDRGALVSTGVYIVRMNAVDFVKSQKMLLLK